MKRYAKLCLPAALICAFAGYLDAVYLSALHYVGGEPPCLLGGGCETVLSSAYANIGPLPLALVGVGYYLSLMLLLIAYLDKRHAGALRAALGIAALGVLASLALVYLQIFVLSAYCIYCLVSAASSLLACLFIGSALAFSKSGNFEH